MHYEYHDIKLTDEGDLDFNADTRDLTICNNIEAFDQQVKMRCLSNTGDIPLHPDICANLEILEGMPNTRDTGSTSENMVTKALYNTSDFPASEVTAKAVPTNKNQITIFVYADIIDYTNITRIYIDVPVFLDGRLE